MQVDREMQRVPFLPWKSGSKRKWPFVCRVPIHRFSNNLKDDPPVFNANLIGNSTFVTTIPFWKGSTSHLCQFYSNLEISRIAGVRDSWLCRKFNKVNSKSEARNPKQYRMTKILNIRNWQCINIYLIADPLLFGNLKIWISNLPFDIAQGGEQVEPFRVSKFDIRI